MYQLALMRSTPDGAAADFTGAVPVACEPLTPCQARVLQLLQQSWARDGAFPSRVALAAAAGLSRSTVQYYIQVLRRKGYLNGPTPTMALVPTLPGYGNSDFDVGED